MIRYFVIAIALTLSACCLRIAPVRSTMQDSVRVVETVRVREVWRDTTVYVVAPAETRRIATPADSSWLETTLAASAAWIDSTGLLHHLLRNRETPLPATVRGGFGRGDRRLRLRKSRQRGFCELKHETDKMIIRNITVFQFTELTLIYGHTIRLFYTTIATVRQFSGQTESRTLCVRLGLL